MCVCVKHSFVARAAPKGDLVDIIERVQKRTAVGSDVRAREPPRDDDRAVNVFH